MAVNHTEDLILLTCASGKQCSNILPNLTKSFQRLRLVCNSSSSADRLRKAYPNAEVRTADLCDPKVCRSLFSGVTTVFHIGPSMHAHETEIGYNMIDAAVAESTSPNSGFHHFVYSSVLCTQFRKMLNHDSKRYVEEYLMETGLSYTIMQPTHFMDTQAPQISGLAKSDAKELTYVVNWDPEVKFSCIALRDLGEAAAKIIEEREKHYFASYPMVSMTPKTYTEMIQIAGKAIGKPMKIEKRPYEAAVNGFLSMMAERGEAKNANPRTRDAVERMLLFYNRRGLVGHPGVLEMVLGRKATSYEEWVGMIIDKAMGG